MEKLNGRYELRLGPDGKNYVWVFVANKEEDLEETEKPVEYNEDYEDR